MAKNKNKEQQPSEDAGAVNDHQAKEDFTEEKSYKPEKEEEGFYHVEVSKGPKFDSETGKPLTQNTTIQKMKPKAFNQFEKNASTLGYSVKVLWEPKVKEEN